MIKEVRTPKIFQTREARVQNQGKVLSQEASAAQPNESVTLTGRTESFKPLKSLSGRALLAQASSSALQAADAAGLPAAITRLFAPAEFLALNNGDYHDAQHPIGVATTVGEMARNSGRGEERAQFLEKVGFIHDADDRVMLDGDGSFHHKEGALPARVPVTLAFMELNRNELQNRLEMDDNQFNEAKVLVAASEHPLNDLVTKKQENHVAGYHGRSPQAILKETLEAVPAERRAELLEEAQLLRYADQMSEYGNGVDSSREAILGLSREIDLDAQILLDGNSNFLNGVGKDNELMKDFPLATINGLSQEMGIQPKIYGQEELYGMLSESHRQSIEDTKAGI